METFPNTDMINRLADVLYKHKVTTTLEEAASIPVDCEKIERVLAEVSRSSDRAAVILIFALIDDLFIQYFSLFLNGQIKGGTASLFDGNGMLATAHNRITMAAALYWIGKATYADLNLIRGIRNKFAHEIDINELSHRKISGIIHSMHKYETVFFKVPELNGKIVSDRKWTDRECFLVRTAMVIKNLVSELILARSAIANKIHPSDTLFIPFDDAPENVRNLSRSIAKFVLSVASSKKETVE